MTIKVTLLDTWQPLTFDLGASDTVAGLKARALGAAHLPADRADGYEVKFGGGRVKDESRTLGSLGVEEGSAFIVLARRRRPVR
jgi:hypothetical protein